MAARTPLRRVDRTRAYRQLWRIVDGAVADALSAHPDYLTPKGERAARASIVKRVTGAVLSYAEQSAKGRSGVSPAAVTAESSLVGSRLARVRSYIRAWLGQHHPSHFLSSGRR